METMMNDVESSMDLKEDITMTMNSMNTNALTTINDILDFGDVHCYMSNNNRVMLLADDVAREMGMVSQSTRIYRTTSGATKSYHNDMIRWERINKYLSQYGLPSISSGQYMDQDAVIYLAIKANTEKARVFHRRLVEVIIPYFISNVSKNEYEEMQKRIQIQDKLIEEAQPAIHMFDEATNDDSYITIKQIADNYGLTAQALNAELYKLDFHYPVRDGWVLYENYKDQGLVCTRKRKLDSGEYEFTIGYTEKGRNVIDQLLHNNGMKTRYEVQTDMNDRIQAYNLMARQQREQQAPQPQIINNYYTTNNYYNQSYPQPPMQYGDKDPNSCPVMFVSKEDREKYKTDEEFRRHLEGKI